MATTTKNPQLRKGSIVLYHGSIKRCHGILFKVLAIWDDRLVLDYYFNPTGDVVMYHVRPTSVTRVAAKDILHRTCRACGTRYWRPRGDDTPCACPFSD